MTDLRAPFPWFGGKRLIAHEALRRFDGAVNYVEPFFGSGAVLLASPRRKVETVNDADGLLVNAWRAIRHAPDETARFADWPVTEADLHARHAWLVGQREPLTRRLEADPEWYDARAAGWWIWGACAWIGSGWCSGNGPWQVTNGGLVRVDAGRGINRQLPHLGNAGRGINRKLPHLGNAGRGEFIRQWFSALSERLRDVRVACGDWQRIVTPSVTWRHGRTAVFLDPPYDDGAINYAAGTRVASDVRAWAVEAGQRDDMMIALCGYDEHEELTRHGWNKLRWKAQGGYGSQSGNKNCERETVWFSPACASVVDDAPQLSMVSQ